MAELAVDSNITTINGAANAGAADTQHGRCFGNLDGETPKRWIGRERQGLEVFIFCGGHWICWLIFKFKFTPRSSLPLLPLWIEYTTEPTR